ncbi:MAG: PhnD/SsuA/transferrin family substrate-binding protein, partial [Oricola sp.]
MDFAPAALALCLAVAPRTPAAADWRTDLGNFRIGVVMENGQRYDSARFEGFRKIVSETLRMPVEIFQARDAAALIDAAATSRIEYSVLSALGYATAFQLCECVEPVVAPVARDGSTAVRSVLVADKAKLSQVSGLAGQRIAAGPPESLGGDLLPSVGFLWQGKRLAESGLDLVRTASTEDSLRMLAEGEVAAAFLWEYVGPGSGEAPVEGPLGWLEEVSPGGFGVLWRSDAIRFGPHALRRNLPVEAKEALRAMLLSLDES